MKKLSLTSVAMAVSALIAAPVFAATNLDAGTGAQRFAAELTPTSTNALVLTATASQDMQATVNLGAGFGANTTFYVRFDIAGGTFNGVMATGATAVAGASTLAVAQSSTSYAVFTIQSGGAAILQTAAVTFTPSQGVRVTDKGGVTLQYRLYTDLADAINGTGHIKDTGAKSYVGFSTAGYSSTSTGTTSTADVSASGGAYTAFVNAAPTNSTSTIRLGSITSTITANVGDVGGVDFSNAAFNNATIVVTAATGDFSFTSNANGGYDAGARANVFLSSNANCAGGVVANSASLSANSATFNALGNANFANGAALYVCATARSGATIGTATFSMQATIPGTSTTQYGNITSPMSTSFGTIAQNGASIYVPMAQVPSGYISRIVLTNISSTARPYSIAAISETGSTVTLSGAAASGTLAANKMTVIDLAGAMAVTGGSPRTTLRVTVNAPASQVRAAYQIVNSSSGSVSNNNLTVE